MSVQTKAKPMSLGSLENMAQTGGDVRERARGIMADENILSNLRKEVFNVQITEDLSQHKFIVDAETVVGESLPEQAMPDGLFHHANNGTRGFFEKLLEGSPAAKEACLAQAKALGLSEDDLKAYPTSAGGQNYVNYFARLSVNNKLAVLPIVLAVNFGLWQSLCKRVLDGLTNNGVPADALPYLKFHGGVPDINWDELALQVLHQDQKRGVKYEYEEFAHALRLFQDYEVDFWNSVSNPAPNAA